MSAQTQHDADEASFEVVAEGSAFLATMPERSEPISRDELDKTLIQTKRIREFILLTAGSMAATHKTLCVQLIAKIRMRARRDWQCGECECRFDIRFEDFQAGGELYGDEEGVCPHCNSVDVEPAAGTLRSNLN